MKLKTIQDLLVESVRRYKTTRLRHLFSSQVNIAKLALPQRSPEMRVKFPGDHFGCQVTAVLLPDVEVLQGPLVLGAALGEVGAVRVGLLSW